MTFEELQTKYPNIKLKKNLKRLSDGKQFKAGDVIPGKEWPNTIIAFDIYRHPGVYDETSEVQDEWIDGNMRIKLFKNRSFTMHRAIFAWSATSNATFEDLEMLKKYGV